MLVLLLCLFLLTVPLGYPAKLRNTTKFMQQHENFGFLDYEVTDIWWPTTQHKPKLVETEIQDQQSEDLSNQQEHNLESGNLTNQLTTQKPADTNSTQNTAPFVEKLKKTMIEDSNGYYTAFLVGLIELLVMKNYYDETIPVLNAFEEIINSSIPKTADADDYAIQTNILKIIDRIKNATPLEIREQLGPLHYTLKTNKKYNRHEYSSFYNYKFDQIYTDTEGISLFEALEEFNKYPKGGKLAKEVALDILTAILKPFTRLYSLPDLSTVISLLNKTYKTKTMFWADPELEETTTKDYMLSSLK